MSMAMRTLDGASCAASPWRTKVKEVVSQRYKVSNLEETNDDQNKSMDLDYYYYIKMSKRYKVSNLEETNDDQNKNVDLDYYYYVKMSNTEEQNPPRDDETR